MHVAPQGVWVGALVARVSHESSLRASRSPGGELAAKVPVKASIVHSEVTIHTVAWEVPPDGVPQRCLLLFGVVEITIRCVFASG